eukprot:CAMPEP_0194292770 /NCGR_PEP_ID=MMETSP0169-20130528/46433_1 /TAXON_ID=218684 /ORGANISM="Corethron pennatum, Strain L29A3" /LENGTH=296 /DNA_ID=CAMNT_0039041075 /DNA_START=48 /DNA_END=938 /DNA_ORIENTATION=+
MSISQESSPTGKKKRPTCSSCHFPSVTCLCPYLPPSPVSLKDTSIVMLQHPHEKKRFNSSVKLLSMCLNGPNLTILRGRRMDKIGGDEAACWLEKAREGRAVLVYPSKSAVGLEEGLREYRRRFELSDNGGQGDGCGPIPLLFLDGTWSHVKEMYNYHVNNGTFPINDGKMICVALDPVGDWTPSRFRTSRFTSVRCPSSISTKKVDFGGVGGVGMDSEDGRGSLLSTAEAVAWAAACNEGKNDTVYDGIARVLDGMVEVQQRCRRNSGGRSVSKKECKRKRDSDSGRCEARGSFG